MKLISKAVNKVITILGKGYPTILVRRRYRIRFGKKLDFNEKILRLEKNWEHPLVVQCADKDRLHDYVRNLGLEEIMPIHQCTEWQSTILKKEISELEIC